MALTLVTGPPVEPVSVATARQVLKIDTTVDDPLIDKWIGAARDFAEALTGRRLITQTWDLKLDAFPCEDVIILPYPPVTSITSITYVDTAGATQTWDAANYLTDLPAGDHAPRARITPAYGLSWPSTRDVINAVAVRFVCGYASPAAVPEGIQSALLAIVAHKYYHREGVIVGTSAQEMPFGIVSDLMPFWMKG
jgi:uncharacterized phiE125 gp8 family phage protein